MLCSSAFNIAPLNVRSFEGGVQRGASSSEDRAWMGGVQQWDTASCEWAGGTRRGSQDLRGEKKVPGAVS